MCNSELKKKKRNLIKLNNHIQGQGQEVMNLEENMLLSPDKKAG